MKKDYSKFRADFHLHVYTRWRDSNWEPGPRDIKTFTEEFNKRGLDLATLTNFNDDRYERFIETAKNLPKSWKFQEYRRGAKVLMPDKRDFYWIKSQEIPTQEGHVLFSGIERGRFYEPSKPLEQTLKEADELTIVIADYAEAVFEDNSMGIGEETLLKYRDYFTAAEYNAGIWLVFPWANKKIEKICATENMSLIASSDAYSSIMPFIGGFPFSNIGKTYTEFNKSTIDFSDIDSLLYSLKQNIIDEKFKIKKKRNSVPSILHHVVMALGYSRLKNLGFKIQHHCDR